MAKRGQGEGSIYLRVDGRWAAAISLGYVGGKLKRKTIYGKTRAAVASKLGDELQKIKQGNTLLDDRQTVGKYLDHWLNECAKPAVRTRTLEGYSTIITNHLKPGLGHIKLAKLTPQHVQRFLNERLASGLSPRTVGHIRALLQRHSTEQYAGGCLPSTLRH